MVLASPVQVVISCHWLTNQKHVSWLTSGTVMCLVLAAQKRGWLFLYFGLWYSVCIFNLQSHVTEIADLTCKHNATNQFIAPNVVEVHHHDFQWTFLYVYVCHIEAECLIEYWTQCTLDNFCFPFLRPFVWWPET